MEIQDKIIDLIKRNRISSTEVADCMNKTGLVKGPKPITPGHFRVGKVRWVYTHHESNWDAHRLLRDAQQGEVVLLTPFFCGDRAVFGSLVAKFLHLYRQVAAVVVQGPVRDAHTLIKENWPIWCEGFTPIGCFNQEPEEPLDPGIIREHEDRFGGAIAVCDDSGVIVVPRHLHTEEFIDKLNFIEEQEDLWFECIDRRKWDTFDTVCLKKYLDEPNA